jgi:hypothetical protein
MTHLAFKTRLNFEPSLPLPRVFFSQNSDTRIFNFPALLRYFGQLFISKWPRIEMAQNQRTALRCVRERNRSR